MDYSLEELIEMVCRHCADGDEAKRRLIVGAIGMAYVNGLLTARSQGITTRMLPQDKVVH